MLDSALSVNVNFYITARYKNDICSGFLNSRSRITKIFKIEGGRLIIDNDKTLDSNKIIIDNFDIKEEKLPSLEEKDIKLFDILKIIS